MQLCLFCLVFGDVLGRWGIFKPTASTSHSQLLSRSETHCLAPSLWVPRARKAADLAAGAQDHSPWCSALKNPQLPAREHRSVRARLRQCVSNRECDVPLWARHPINLGKLHPLLLSLMPSGAYTACVPAPGALEGAGGALRSWPFVPGGFPTRAIWSRRGLAGLGGSRRSPLGWDGAFVGRVLLY